MERNVATKYDADREDRIRSLELTLVEHRSDHAALERLYDQARVKILTFIAAGLTLLTYLYGSVPETKTELVDKLFIPAEPYGVIVYTISLSMFLLSLGMLFLAVHPRPWSTAIDDEQEDCISEDYEKYFKYMRKRYLRCSKINGNSYAQQQRLLGMAFPLLLLGAILLVVLKTFGG